MKNLDIIILNVIVIFCFITFFISTFRAFENVTKKENPKFEKRGIISRFLAYLQSLVND
jgi:high-affinity nickel permease